jgi:hypothetical protein
MRASRNQDDVHSSTIHEVASRGIIGPFSQILGLLESGPLHSQDFSGQSLSGLSRYAQIPDYGAIVFNASPTGAATFNGAIHLLHISYTPIAKLLQTSWVDDE